MATDADSRVIADLLSGDITVHGRLVEASNATLYVTISNSDDPDHGLTAVYKPIAGERPLWDFPDGTLSFREVAAFEISQSLGWQVVPPTLLREGPYGLGMVQAWIDTDPTIDLIELSRSDHPDLLRMALFDAVVNNTDRKIGHLLPTEDGRVRGCDHGVTFHVEEKLRTVLWQWMDQEIPQVLVADLERLCNDLMLGGSGISKRLSTLLAEDEISALIERLEGLIRQGRFPLPSESWPAVPWPPY
jgi:uncharacterized repeat protein (TIGR03843 family)